MVLAGRYTLDDEPLGSGGMGEAWAAWDAEMERRVAVKTVRPSPGRQPDSKTLFREARTAGRLNHPGIVTVHDIARDDTGRPFLVMELIHGRDLARVLSSGEPCPVGTALDWAAQVADALQAAHAAGVVHRDLKPSNLMLTDSGTIKILDFGIAGLLDSTHTVSEPIGSLPYMAPERIDGMRGDARTDLYALGCVLHELLTGRPPFDGLSGYALLAAHKETVPASLGTLRSGLPVGLDELGAALLAKAPDDRPPTAAEVRDRLRDLMAVPAEPAVPAGPSAPARHPVAEVTTAPRPRADAATDSNPLRPRIPPSPHRAWLPRSPIPPGPPRELRRLRP
ncbi:serine/threonine-protein kinase [Streptomyces nojiriensis]